MGTISEALKSRIQQRDAEQPATPIRGLQRSEVVEAIDRLGGLISRDKPAPAPDNTPAWAKTIIESNKALSAKIATKPRPNLELKKNISEAVKSRITSRAAEEPQEAIRGLPPSP